MAFGAEQQQLLHAARKEPIKAAAQPAREAGVKQPGRAQRPTKEKQP